MAFPASKDLLALMVLNLQGEVRSLRERLTDVNAFLLLNSASANLFIELYAQLVGWEKMFVNYRNDPTLDTIGKIEFPDQKTLLSAELDILVSLIDSLLQTINALFPKSADGYILKDKLGLDGTDVRAFSPLDTAPVRDSINAVLGSIA